MFCNAYAVIHFYLAIKQHHTNGPSLALVLWFLTGANKHLCLAALVTIAAIAPEQFETHAAYLLVWAIAVLALHAATFGLLFWEFRAQEDGH